MKVVTRFRTPIAAAILVGIAGGALVALARTPQYGFLPGARLLKSVEQRNGTMRELVARYLPAESTDAVLERLRREAPLRLERETRVAGKRTWVVTVPRMQDGRAVVTFPPAREVTVVEGSLVQVREFRSPGALDALVEFVKRPLGA